MKDYKKYLLSAIVLNMMIFVGCGEDKLKSNYIGEGDGSYTINYSVINKMPHKASLTISTGDVPQGFNPYIQQNESEKIIKSCVFNSLLTVDKTTGEYTGELAESFQVNGNSLKIELKKGVKFSDGTPLTAADVAESINFLTRIYDNTLIKSYYFELSQQIAVEITGDYEFTITTSYPDLLLSLTRIPIIKGADLLKITDYRMMEDLDVSSLTGTGPYKIVKLNYELARFERNNFYFKKYGGVTLPFTDEIELKFYKYYQDALVTFIDGNADIVSCSHGNLPDIYKMRSEINRARLIDTGIGGDAQMILTFFKNRNENALYADKIMPIIKDDFGLAGMVNSEKINKSLKIKKRKYDKKHPVEGEMELLIPKLDNKLALTADEIKKALDGKNIDAKIETLDIEDYLKRVYIEHDYNIALLSADFSGGLRSVLGFLGNGGELNPGFTSQPSSFEKLNSGIIDSYKTYTQIFSDTDKFLLSNRPGSLIYHEKKYYLIRDNIMNFRVKSDTAGGYDTDALEFIISRDDIKKVK